MMISLVVAIALAIALLVGGSPAPVSAIVLAVVLMAWALARFLRWRMALRQQIAPVRPPRSR